MSKVLSTDAKKRHKFGCHKTIGNDVVQFYYIGDEKDSNAGKNTDLRRNS